jgi:hypothetical protein
MSQQFMMMDRWALDVGGRVEGSLSAYCQMRPMLRPLSCKALIERNPRARGVRAWNAIAPVGSGSGSCGGSRL